MSSIFVSYMILYLKLSSMVALQESPLQELLAYLYESTSRAKAVSVSGADCIGIAQNVQSFWFLKPIFPEPLDGCS